PTTGPVRRARAGCRWPRRPRRTRSTAGRRGGCGAVAVAARTAAACRSPGTVPASATFPGPRIAGAGRAHREDRPLQHVSAVVGPALDRGVALRRHLHRLDQALRGPAPGLALRPLDLP